MFEKFGKSDGDFMSGFGMVWYCVFNFVSGSV